MPATSKNTSWIAGGLGVLREDAGALLARGATAGLVGGMAFILANMWYATAHGKPGVAPLLAISTIFNGTAHPVLSASAIPGEVVEGLTLHILLSLTFGAGFGILAAFVRRRAWLVAAAIAYGLALFVLNFEILGRTVFPFFTSPHGPNNVFEGFVHPLIFGVLLIPFFLGHRPGSTARRSTAVSGAEPAAIPGIQRSRSAV